MNYIEIKKENIDNLSFEKAAFFFMAEENAMGRPGEVEIVLEDGTCYTFNYVYEDIRFHDFERVFPSIRDCDYGVHGVDRMEMEGWKYVSLSSGNHLLIISHLFDDFKSNYESNVPPVYLYQNWKRWAAEICGF